MTADHALRTDSAFFKHLCTVFQHRIFANNRLIYNRAVINGGILKQYTFGYFCVFSDITAVADYRIRTDYRTRTDDNIFADANGRHDLILSFRQFPIGIHPACHRRQGQTHLARQHICLTDSVGSQITNVAPIPCGAKAVNG